MNHFAVRSLEAQFALLKRRCGPAASVVDGDQASRAAAASAGDLQNENDD